MHNLFYQLVINMEKYLPQKVKGGENNECHKALVFFHRPLPFLANISPYKLQAVR